MCRVATAVCWDACIGCVSHVCSCFGEFGKQENRDTNGDKTLLHGLICKKGKTNLKRMKEQHIYG